MSIARIEKLILLLDSTFLFIKRSSSVRLILLVHSLIRFSQKLVRSIFIYTYSYFCLFICEVKGGEKEKNRKWESLERSLC